jgi:hypothetical protein
MSLALAAVLLLVAILVFFLLLGGFTSGTGADFVDWDPIGRANRRAGLDQSDFEELLELNNRHRRERGCPCVGCGGGCDAASMAQP